MINKKYMLKKDIIIKKGTIFETVASRRYSYSINNVASIIGLTKDTSGEFSYYIDPNDKAIKVYFEEIKK